MADTTCTRPPAGWRCTREAGHEGPCAAMTDTTRPDGVEQTVTAQIHEHDESHVHATLRAPKMHEYALSATRDDLTRNWYIEVTDEGGYRLYDGYWRDSARRSCAEVLVEAAHGSSLGELTAPASKPAEGGVVDADAEQALDLLAVLFDAYENGVSCYEDPEDFSGFLGNAVRLDDDTFHACADLLNRRRPVAAAARAALAREGGV